MMMVLSDVDPYTLLDGKFKKINVARSTSCEVDNVDNFMIVRTSNWIDCPG